MTALLISAAAETLGVSPSALRLWEREGLVRPQRTRAGYRQYTDADVARLRAVLRLRRVERVNAPGIRRILDGDRRRPTPDPRIDGLRLRQMRRERGLGLREAAARCRMSASHLSAIERGMASPSVAALQRITHAYDTTVAALLSARTGWGVLHAGDRSVTALGAGVRIEQLAVAATLLEPQLFVLAPGASSDGAYAHDGEEFLYLLAGELTVWVGDDATHRLTRPGDTLTFPSTIPHRWRNDARGETRLLWINTPPTF